MSDRELIEAAKMLKEYCKSVGCDECPFVGKRFEDCAISSWNPSEWRLPEGGERCAN